jgi:hypothetical protein
LSQWHGREWRIKLRAHSSSFVAEGELRARNRWVLFFDKKGFASSSHHKFLMHSLVCGIGLDQFRKKRMKAHLPEQGWKKLAILFFCGMSIQNLLTLNGLSAKFKRLFCLFSS